MADILEEIVAYKKKEIEHFKKEISQVYLEGRVEILQNARMASMSETLKHSDTGIIAEFKRKSPSKGWINKEATAKKVPRSYELNGATAISILTDSHFFGGSNVFVREARIAKVSLPILYKNFIIDDYQI